MKEKITHPFLAISGMLVGTFVGMFSETSLNIALPTLMKSFNTSAATIQWLVTGYMLVIGIILPLSSIITKWFTTRQIIIFALVDFIVGAAISGLAINFPILLVGRMIQGIGTGLIIPLVFAVSMKIFPSEKIGTAMGICALVIMFAPAIGPTLTGFILARLSWNWIFWIFILFLLVALILSIFFLVNVDKVTRSHVDKLSIVESIIGCSCIVVGVSFASNLGWTALPVLSLLIVVVLVLAFYAMRQLKLSVPILNIKIFSNPTFALGAVIVMLDFGMILSAMYLLPMYLQNGLLISVAETGLIMLPGGLINALSSALSGRIYDSVGFKKPAVCGFIIALIGAVMLAFVTPKSSIIYVISAQIILMIGGPLALSPAQSGALNALPGLQTGDGSTILNTMQQIFGAICTAVTTSFLEMGEKAIKASSPVRVVNGVHYGIYFTICIIIIGIILTSLVHENVKASKE